MNLRRSKRVTAGSPSVSSTPEQIGENEIGKNEIGKNEMSAGDSLTPIQRQRRKRRRIVSDNSSKSSGLDEGGDTNSAAAQSKSDSDSDSESDSEKNNDVDGSAVLNHTPTQGELQWLKFHKKLDVWGKCSLEVFELPKDLTVDEAKVLRREAADLKGFIKKLKDVSQSDHIKMLLLSFATTNKKAEEARIKALKQAKVCEELYVKLQAASVVINAFYVSSPINHIILSILLQVRVTGSDFDHDKPKTIRGMVSFNLRTQRYSTILASSLKRIPSQASINALIRLSKSGFARSDFFSLLSLFVSFRTKSSFHKSVSCTRRERNQTSRITLTV